MGGRGSESYDRWDVEARAALLRDVCACLGAQAALIVPALIVPALPLPPARRFVKRGGYMCCALCGYTIEFCGCDKQPAPDQPSADDTHASAGLAQRARECKGGR